MRLHLNDSSDVPLFQQIVQQVMAMIAAGRLAPGDEVPPIRTLSEQSMVNPNTVVRAYRELETLGALYKRRTAGTFIADRAVAAARKWCRQWLAGRMDALLREAQQMNIDLDEVIELLRQRDEMLQPEGK
jgi:GntR family transcriptional regulator